MANYQKQNKKKQIEFFWFWDRMLLKGQGPQGGKVTENERCVCAEGGGPCQTP